MRILVVDCPWTKTRFLQRKLQIFVHVWALIAAWVGLVIRILSLLAGLTFDETHTNFFFWFGLALLASESTFSHCIFAKVSLSSPCPAGTPTPLYLLHKSDCLHPSQHTYDPDFFDLSRRLSDISIGTIETSTL